MNLRIFPTAVRGSSGTNRISFGRLAGLSLAAHQAVSSSAGTPDDVWCSTTYATGTSSLTG